MDTWYVYLLYGSLVPLWNLSIHYVISVTVVCTRFWKYLGIPDKFCFKFSRERGILFHYPGHDVSLVV